MYWYQQLALLSYTALRSLGGLNYQSLHFCFDLVVPGTSWDRWSEFSLYEVCGNS
jgi:hypothetical protein